MRTPSSCSPGSPGSFSKKSKKRQRESKEEEGEKEEEDEDESPEPLPVPSPQLQTRSMQQILDSSSLDTIAHHDGSGNTYMANKVLKLQSMHDPAGDSGMQTHSDIFAGCCVFVNGDTNPTRYEIQRLVRNHHDDPATIKVIKLFPRFV
jgi:hypothetical protein